MAYLASILLYLIPVLFIAFFVVSLVMYIKTVKKNKKCPDSCLQVQIKTWKILLITSSCIAGVLLTVVIAIIALLYMAVAYM